MWNISQSLWSFSQSLWSFSQVKSWNRLHEYDAHVTAYIWKRFHSQSHEPVAQQILSDNQYRYSWKNSQKMKTLSCHHFEPPAYIIVRRRSTMKNFHSLKISQILKPLSNKMFHVEQKERLKWKNLQMENFTK